MDFDKFLCSLDADFKAILTAFAVCLPLAYLDAWLLFPQFRVVEFMVQVFLSSGVAVTFVLSGIVGDIIVRHTQGYHEMNPSTVLVAASAFCASVIILMCQCWDVAPIFVAAFLGCVGGSLWRMFINLWEGTTHFPKEGANECGPERLPKVPREDSADKTEDKAHTDRKS